MYIHIHFHILFHYVLSQDNEYSSRCYIIGPCLSILYIIACICQSQTPHLSLPDWESGFLFVGLLKWLHK